MLQKLKDYKELVKFTLSFTVVFSSVICYLLAPNIININWIEISKLFLSGFLVTACANAINQILEVDTDALMKRTANRPLAAKRMSELEASIFAWMSGVIGIGLMWHWFNGYAALLSLVSICLYAFVYTPLKKVSSVSVLIGGIPGALPCLIGWIAATGQWSIGGWILFLIQFFWQFPHFWAIAWVAHNDYKKAGFKLLPNMGAPTKNTALRAITYSFIMIPIGLLPYFSGMSGIYSACILFIGNVFILFLCIRLYIKMDITSARWIMFSSYIYLPVILFSLLADKIVAF